MTTLVWDQVGERKYQTGIEHGILYLQDGTVVVWNGLTNIEESSNSELKAYHQDGVKYLEILIPGDFIGKLKAFTYPEEFDLVNGIAEFAPGFSIHDQRAKSFSLSYKTKIGNDIEGTDHGYKIHILYNVIANPEAHTFETFQDSGVQPIEFGWTLTGTPPKMGILRPTVHISIDSTKTSSNILQMIEDKLYGTEVSNASLPSIQEVAEYFGYFGALIIVDHGDGTWSAIDESISGIYINMIDATMFEIKNADAIYLDSEIYEISSTNVDNPL